MKSDPVALILPVDVCDNLDDECILARQQPTVKGFPVVIQVAKRDERVLLIDDDDAWALDRCWIIKHDKRDNWFGHSYWRGVNHRLHRVIMNAQPGERIMALDKNLLNCQRSNLVRATIEQVRKYNTPLMTGIEPRSHGRYEVTIKHTRLGIFRTKEEAEHVRDAAVTYLYGSYMPTIHAEIPAWATERVVERFAGRFDISVPPDQRIVPYKLSADDVIAIKDRWRYGEFPEDIAHDFNVSVDLIYGIISGRNWRGVGREFTKRERRMMATRNRTYHWYGDDQSNPT